MFVFAAYATLVELCIAAMNAEIQEITLFIPNIGARFAHHEAVQQYVQGMQFEAKLFPLSDEYAIHQCLSLFLFVSPVHSLTFFAILQAIRSDTQRAFGQGSGAFRRTCVRTHQGAAAQGLGHSR